ncbi:MAG: hypothetical protein MAG795_01124 [Candidatus Woesearchaeota archaeon]|nr:hypothetical protein [Candidatus Woesearchaeota archaeon]
MSWQIKKIGETPKLNNPVLIEGLPGIANVGKIVVDFLLEELDAKKIYEFFSYSMPQTVFVNEDNMIDLPVIEMYYVKHKKQDLLLLAGDVQPTSEESCYEFVEEILKLAKKHSVSHLITLGGIGLRSVPKEPKLYCTGNSKKLIKTYTKDSDVENELFGVVGPIVGVSGVLLGLGKKQDIQAISLLAETLGHPMFIGVKGSKKILEVLDEKLELSVDMEAIKKEIKDMEKKFSKKKARLKDIAKQRSMGKKIPGDTSYIG